MINKNSTKQEVLEAVRLNGYALCFASDELRNDREVVLAAVNQEGWALRHASEELQNDREMVLAAVKQWGRQPLLCRFE